MMEAEVDTSRWKIFLIGSLGVVLAALSGYTLLASFKTGLALYYLSFIGTLFLFLNIFVLQTLLIKYFQTQALIIIAELAVFSAFFIQILWRSLSGTFIILFAIAAALVVISAQSGRNNMQTSLKVHFFTFSAKTLRSATSGLVLLIVLFYLAFNGNRGAPLSQEVINAVLRFSEPFAQTQIPALSFNLTVREFLEKLALSGLTAEERERLVTLPAVARSGFITNAVQNVKDLIGRYVMLENVNENDKLSVAIYRLITEKFAAASPSLQTSILITSGLLLFTILRVLVWPLTILVTFSAYIIYQILLALGFARIALEIRSREIVLMP